MKTRLYTIDKVAIAFALFALIQWFPYWHVEILSPLVADMSLYVLPALLLPLPIRDQARREQKWCFPCTLLLGLITPVSVLAIFVTVSFIPFPWPTQVEKVGNRKIEVCKAREYGDTGVGMILIREIIPICPGIRFAKDPVAKEDQVASVRLNVIDKDTFQYQFEEPYDAQSPREFPLKTVHYIGSKKDL